MRKIDKPARPIPESLMDCFIEQQANLLEKKEQHRFSNACYNTSIKSELNRYYHNKCAFCETLLNDRFGNSYQFTVEHFRPKSLYYWLGYEWTNLMPTCWACNEKKKNDFSLPDKRHKAEVPLVEIENGNSYIDLSKCNAHAAELKAENAYLLHPELENPMDFLQFDLQKIGYFMQDTAASPRAAYTINTCVLNRTELSIERRKKIYDTLFAQFEEQMIELLSQFPTDCDNRHLQLAFGRIFSTLYQNSVSSTAEYTAFWAFLLFNFDQLFIQKMPTPKTQEILTQALKFYIEQQTA